MIQDRHFDDSVYRPGIPVKIGIEVVPDFSVLAYALEETPPVGWEISGINNSGHFVGGIIKWGVFFDSNGRSFAYEAKPPLNQAGEAFWAGLISLDGVSTPIEGALSLSLDQEPPSRPI